MAYVPVKTPGGIIAYVNPVYMTVLSNTDMDHSNVYSDFKEAGERPARATHVAEPCAPTLDCRLCALREWSEHIGTPFPFTHTHVTTMPMPTKRWVQV